MAESHGYQYWEELMKPTESKPVETLPIRKELLYNILVFFYRDFEDYTGARLVDYDDDDLVTHIVMHLANDYNDKWLEEHFPGKFAVDDEE